jgi:Protein of unknown function (DUF3102)
MSAKKTVSQVPKISDEDLAIEPQVLERIAELDAKVFRSIADRREASIEIGRALTEEKAILGHGKFQRHFAEKFASSFTLRTAERYMKRARKADSLLNIDSVSIFKSASDEGAREIRKATQQAQAEVEAMQAQDKAKSEVGLYRLMLRIPDHEIDVMDRLRESSDWPRAERQILRLLRRLWVEYDIIDEDPGEE